MKDKMITGESWRWIIRKYVFKYMTFQLKDQSWYILPVKADLQFYALYPNNFSIQYINTDVDYQISYNYISHNGPTHF